MTLDAKIPPPAVALLAAVLIWGIARLAPLVAFPTAIRVVLAVALCAAGVAFAGAGVQSFKRERTTLDPTRPANASSLVSTGVFRVTRNPMYLGLLLVLMAWTVLLSSAWGLLGAAGFVLYMNHFQIKPEERALEKRFRDDYTTYAARVRRWL